MDSLLDQQIVQLSAQITRTKELDATPGNSDNHSRFNLPLRRERVAVQTPFHSSNPYSECIEGNVQFVEISKDVDQHMVEL